METSVQEVEMALTPCFAQCKILRGFHRFQSAIAVKVRNFLFMLYCLAESLF